MCNTAPGSEPTPPPLLPRWQELRTRLKTSPGREFERNAWPLLHIIAPQVRLAPELGDLDRAGLDAVEPERHGHGLAHAFQMKSAASPRFRFSSFVKGCRKSLADFVRSGHRAREFIFIVNAWGREPEILAEIEPDLRRLHTEGKAEGVTFCSVDDFVQKALFEARSHISFATQYAATALHVEALTGDFRDFEPLRSVPARVAFLEVDPRSGVHERSAQMREDFDPVELGELGASGNGTRKTLLTGMFGSGKSTAIKIVASNCARLSFVVPCRFLPPLTADDTGLSGLHRFILHHLGIAKRWGARFAGIEELLAEATQTLLQEDRCACLAVFDGLDEHRYYASEAGFRVLLALTASFSCPVLFTVRSEFIESGLGRYERAILESAPGADGAAPLRLVEFRPWAKTQISEFILRNQAHLDAAKRERVAELVRAVDTGAIASLFGDLPANPLLLGYLIEEVAESGLRPLERAEVVFNHIVRKLRRDREVRSRPQIEMDAPERQWMGFVLQGLCLCARTLEANAGRSVGRAGILGAPLAEHFQSLSWEEAIKCFGNTPAGIPPMRDEIIGSGVLRPRATDPYSPARVYFVLQVFHDFFMALSFECLWPTFDDPIIEAWQRSIRASCEARPESELAKYVRLWKGLLSRASGGGE